MKVLVTGASGFIGSAVTAWLLDANHEVVAAVRDCRSYAQENSRLDCVSVGDIGPSTSWSKAIQGVDCVVHLAAIADAPGDNTEDARRELIAVNVDATAALALHAKEAGVQRFIFISSIKVNAGASAEHLITPTSPLAPADEYGESKLQAEHALQEIFSAPPAAPDLAIIRPVAVYGPGQRGNLAKLASLAKKGIPLPFGGLRNKRSVLSIYNLCDLIELCMSDPRASGGIFLAADKEPATVPELIQAFAAASGNARTRLVPVPVNILRWLGRGLRRDDEIARLIYPLVVDASDTFAKLGWTPGYTLRSTFDRPVEKTWKDPGE